MTTQVKRPRGRPKLEDADKRTTTVKVQLRADEHDRLKQHANGRKLSAYMREKALTP